MATYRLVECDYCKKALRLDFAINWYLFFKHPKGILFCEFNSGFDTPKPIQKKHVCDTCIPLLFSLRPIEAWEARIVNGEIK